MRVRLGEMLAVSALTLSPGTVSAGDDASPFKISEAALAGEGLETFIEYEGAPEAGLQYLLQNQIAVSIYQPQTPASWTVDGFPYDEVVFVLAGELALTDHAGNERLYGPGESVIIPDGFVGEMGARGEVYRQLAVSPSDILAREPGLAEGELPAAPVPVDAATLSGKGLTPMRTDDVPVPQQIGFLLDGNDLAIYVWEVEPFKVTRPLPYDELFQVLEGRLRLSDESGFSEEFAAGDLLVIPSGWTGSWDLGVGENLRLLGVMPAPGSGADGGE